MTTPEPHCPRVAESGAYLLGSLPPAERADYAAHLPDCQHCLAEVGQLAGLPGLLARSPGPPPGARLPSDRPAQQAPWEADPGPVAGALAEIRHQRVRRRALTAAAFVLVGLLGAGATSLAAGAFAQPATGVTAAPELPVRMDAVGNAPVSAALALAERPWGTEVVMRCRYQSPPEDRAPVYILVATAADGTRTELARWTAVPDQDVVLATATDLTRQQLASLEVRNTSGKVVLRTDHV